jgi:hypothetical protein
MTSQTSPQDRVTTTPLYDTVAATQPLPPAPRHPDLYNELCREHASPDKPPNLVPSTATEPRMAPQEHHAAPLPGARRCENGWFTTADGTTWSPTDGEG